MELSEYCESLAKACEDAGNWVGRNEDVVRNEKEGLLKELRRAKRSFKHEKCAQAYLVRARQANPISYPHWPGMKTIT